MGVETPISQSRPTKVECWIEIFPKWENFNRNLRPMFSSQIKTILRIPIANPAITRT